MEERQRLEIAGRIVELRERSRWTQPQLAEQLGLTLRGYQKLEEKGTTKYERAEELAKIHGVDPEWIWAGVERAATPDVLGAFSGENRSQLDRIEEALVELRSEVAALGVELAASKAQGRRPPRSRPG